jgi:hypothetical protein
LTFSLPKQEGLQYSFNQVLQAFLCPPFKVRDGSSTFYQPARTGANGPAATTP